MPKEWWENFFSGMILDLWKEVYDESQTKAEADFILEVLSVPQRAAILDVPCGEGRLTCELASRGYALTGVDLSLAFLDQARSKTTLQGMDIRWEHRDMRDLPWLASFDGAFCFGCSFGYFNDEGNAKFLQSVCHSLKPGAGFVVDVGLSTEMLLPRLRDREWNRVGDFLFLEENQYDHVEGRLKTEYTVVRNGQAVTRVSSNRVYTYSELVRLLKSAGFANIQSFGSLARDPFALDSPRLLFVAKAKG